MMNKLRIFARNSLLCSAVFCASQAQATEIAPGFVIDGYGQLHHRVWRFAGPSNYIEGIVDLDARLWGDPDALHIGLEARLEGYYHFEWGRTNGQGVPQMPQFGFYAQHGDTRLVLGNPQSAFDRTGLVPFASVSPVDDLSHGPAFTRTGEVIRNGVGLRIDHDFGTTSASASYNYDYEFDRAYLSVALDRPVVDDVVLGVAVETMISSGSEPRTRARFSIEGEWRAPDYGVQYVTGTKFFPNSIALAYLRLEPNPNIELGVDYLNYFGFDFGFPERTILHAKYRLGSGAYVKLAGEADRLSSFMVGYEF
jgi:hypothetical protein